MSDVTRALNGVLAERYRVERELGAWAWPRFTSLRTSGIADVLVAIDDAWEILWLLDVAAAAGPGA